MATTTKTAAPPAAEHSVTSLTIIALAGESKAESMAAIEAASEDRFSEVTPHLTRADELLMEAHRTQSALVQDEVNGIHTTVDVLLVHAQNHLAMAQTARETADELASLYRRLHEIRSEIVAA